MAVGWKGDPDAFVAALLASGCLEDSEHGLRHNFPEFWSNQVEDDDL